ncbi:hypothetical protein RYO59_002528 [Thermosynechococcaceae cyanobacterium Okahandja]
MAMLALDLRTHTEKTYCCYDLHPKTTVPVQEQCWLVQSGTVESDILSRCTSRVSAGFPTSRLDIPAPRHLSRSTTPDSPT